MPNDFLQQFMAGWQMGQGRNESMRRDLELQQQQEQEMYRRQAEMEDRALRQQHLKLQEEEIRQQRKRAQFEDAVQESELRRQAAGFQGLVSPPTAADMGIPQQGPEFGGPPPEQINVSQPMQNVPSLTGGPDIQIPIPTGRQQEELTARAQQQKMLEALMGARARAQAEAETRPPERPVSVSPGGTLIDPATGKVIFRAPERPPSSASLTGEGGKPLLSGEINKVSEIDQGLKDADVLREQILGKGGTGAASALGALIPNVVTEYTGVGAGAKQRQAVIARVKQIIGKALEGGVLRKEDEAKYAKILPTISDAPEVAQSKIDGLVQTLNNNRDVLLENYAAAGRDVSKFIKPKAAPPAPAPSRKYKVIEVR